MVHLLLGGIMRIGSLVKNVEFDYIGVVVNKIDNWWLIKWIDHEVYETLYSDCELEVICE
jgi:hypothetical protein